MEKILIAAFDGLLPEQVSPALTPAIHDVSRRGVRFSRHHAVFPTVTRANVATMVTGCYPGKHGIPANRAVFPEIDTASVTDVLFPEMAALAKNHDVLLVPTMGELLAAQGMSHVSVVGGTSGNAYMHHPKAAESGKGGVIHPEFALPSDLFREVEARFGPWPPGAVPNIGPVERVGDITLDFVVPELKPDVLFVWFPEPDKSNHVHGLGSAESNAGLAAADHQLGRILAALNDRGDAPDVFIISDHGYSTINAKINVSTLLAADGFRVDEGEGSVIVADNGGAVLLNYPGAEDAGIERLSVWLAAQPWAGAVLSSLPGTDAFGFMAATDAGLDGPRCPDFALTLAWDRRPGQRGFNGNSPTSGAGSIGAGTHGSGSPREISNTLIAAGPSFKTGVVSRAPSGNIDLAPTVLALMGVDRPPHMDGRVLDEALTGGPESESVQTEVEYVMPRHKASGSEVSAGHGLQRSHTNGTTYIDSVGLE